MDEYLRNSADEQKVLCQEAAAKMGLPAASIEKDYWVCWTLRELTELEQWGTHLSFKGGTSLSKAWQLIERFSEDIDLVIDRAWLGFSEEAPGSSALRRLKQVCEAKINGELLPLLRREFQLKLEGDWDLRSAREGEGDAQTLVFEYPGVLKEHIGYLKPHVKIEFGARSDTDPYEMATIRPFLNEIFPEILGGGDFLVRTVSARRTFWEKALLLHEENHRPRRTINNRLSRHYYDLWSMIENGVAKDAISDIELFQRVVDHRSIYFHIGSIDQSTLTPQSLRICPPQDRHDDWKRDYLDMRAEMFYGDPPEFEAILDSIAEVERRINEL